jgi:DNA sulfur modification protein DndD
MAAVMRVLGWKAVGLRCPDHEIMCCNNAGQAYPVTLIQMPNGTGKTTTLALLRAAFSGNAVEWEPEKIAEYQKKNSNSKIGKFELRLLLNDRRVTIIMEFDFETGSVYYKTTRGSGQVKKFDPPPDFSRFLNSNFVNFFVFDGELAQHLLDKTHTRAESVVENLFHINVFAALKNQLQQYWDDKIQNISATESTLKKRQNKVVFLRARLVGLEKEKQALTKKKGTLSAKLTTQQDIYSQEISKEQERSHKLSKIEEQVGILKSQTREKSLEVLDIMRDPHSLSLMFANDILQLKLGLDRVKLPESAAREFFDELASESICVCGRPIDHEVGLMIRERAQQYFGSDNVALLNSIKSSIHEAVGPSTSVPAALLDSKLSDLNSVVDAKKQAQNELDELQFEAEQADPAVKAAKEEMEQLERQLSDIEDELEKFDTKDEGDSDERTFGIAAIKKRIKTSEEKLAEITETIELKRKRDALDKILTRAHTLSRSAITKELCNESNDRIRKLMPDNNILIERIESCLVLHGQEGGSVGETLSVAYAFLATLFHRSDHQLPFVVDSPAGSIDLAVRPKIAELIPKLSGQFIAFTISSERQGFVQRLKLASDSTVEFLTLFRKGSKELEKSAKKQPDCAETSDGLRVRGESFFNSFQLDEEEV